MKKIFKNSSGNIVIQETKKSGCGIVEMIHLWDNDIAGCAIGYWKVRKVDEKYFPEFTSVHNRFITTEYDFDIFKALKFGQKLAEILIETKNEK